MNLLFPTIKIEKPSQEMAQIYAHITGVFASRRVLFSTLALCALTVVVPFVAVGAKALAFVYVCPTLVIAVGSMLTVAAKRFARFGVLLCLIALENVLLTGSAPLLLSLQQVDNLTVILYYLFLLGAFVSVIVLYHLRYKKFDKIMSARVHNKQYSKKNPWAGFLGIVSLVVVVRLIVNTFAMWMIGGAILLTAIYYMSPLIAEQLVIVRQYNQMEPYLQEYAGEENEPEV